MISKVYNLVFYRVFYWISSLKIKPIFKNKQIVFIFLKLTIQLTIVVFVDTIINISILIGFISVISIFGICIKSL